MDNKKIRIVCVGIGGYASVYWKSLLPVTDPDFEIVGGVDPYPDAAQFYPELVARGIPVYPDMDSFFAEKEADLAIITTPIHLHTRQILSALDHGLNVLCEKPLSGVSADAELIEQKAKQVGKFVMIGYQWSYAPAINNLKRDILDGKFGAPVSLKTIILWPRDLNYFKRGSGWAGRLYAKDGTPIYDSVAANACAHYLHNMLYVCGDIGKAAAAKDVRAVLLRTNDIENFDTATISFKLDCGASCLFVATHSSDVNRNPRFDYRFEHATVKYDETTKDIVAYLDNGEEIHYGNPFAGGPDGGKSRLAIDGTRNGGYAPVCTPYTAAEHARCIETVQNFPIINLPSELVEDCGGKLVVKGLTEALFECYDKEVLLDSTELYERLVK